MIEEVEICRHVFVPDADLSKKSVVRTLMSQLPREKACKQQGYLLAVTKLKSIGGHVLARENHVLFPVVFRCRVFLPIKGETLKGKVYLVKRLGVLLKCGPTKHVYLSAQKMPGYYLVAGDAPYFQNERLDRIERGVVICFKVLDVKWVENYTVNIKREFQMIGEPFGSVSLPGFDNSEI